MRDELEAYLSDTRAMQEQTEQCQKMIQQQKGRLAPKNRPEKVGFFTQVLLSHIHNNPCWR